MPRYPGAGVLSVIGKLAVFRVADYSPDWFHFKLLAPHEPKRDGSLWIQFAVNSAAGLANCESLTSSRAFVRDANGAKEVSYI
jgi:hypothetical protein